MEFTINSRKLGRPITFFCGGSAGYIYADLNGQQGTLGKQLCKGGALVGSTLYHAKNGLNEADNLALFKITCRAWFRSYLRNLGAYNTGVYFNDTL